MLRAGLASENGTPSSLWQLKPWWCQPWSILLTGLTAMVGSWLFLHRWWISVPVSLAIVMWWWVFLVVVPRAFQAELDGEESLTKDQA
jgi:hypothetical protein